MKSSCKWARVFQGTLLIAGLFSSPQMLWRIDALGVLWGWVLRRIDALSDTWVGALRRIDALMGPGARLPEPI